MSTPGLPRTLRRPSSSISTPGTPTVGDIPELVGAIVRFVAPRELLIDTQWSITPERLVQKRAIRRDLYALLNTSGIFVQHALDGLWYSVESLRVIFNLLGVPKSHSPSVVVPGHNWVMLPELHIPEDLYSGLSLEVIKEYVSALDMNFIMSCTRRIRCLRIDGRDLTVNLIDVLFHFFPPGSTRLIPNLHILVWRIGVEQHACWKFRSLSLFLSDTIQKLHIFHVGWCERCVKPHERRQVLHGLSTMTSLQELHFMPWGHFHYYSYMDLHSPNLTNIISAIPQGEIRVLRCQFSLQDGAMKRVSMMPKLRVLDINSSLEGSVALFPPPAATFRALEDVAIDLMNIPQCIAFLEFLPSASQLTSVKIGHKIPAQENQVADLCLCIANTCSPATLHCIAIKVSENRPLPPSPPLGLLPIPVTTTSVAPLLAFGSLTIFHFAGCVIDWDDQLIRDMAQAWPSLINLTVRADLPWQTGPQTSQITLFSLASLAEFCPHLEYVNLAMHSWSQRYKAPVRDWDHGNTAQRVTVFMRVWMQQLDNIAIRFVQGVFPNVQQINCDWEDWKEEDEE
ncbi:hypothetical protein EVG20_g6320 [Dentipellis fragilis]|uniref:F-box domain-containing protein n=1 Tax=Dentipellis fragilis TaxID=205917 RepID=A0A4Y9YNH2_9AGAM|nr:hypothetical protein EVG20_g6320 [Dentipellis fragilis]